MNADLEEQEDELVALQSIFGSDEFLRHESKSAGEIRVSVELPADFTVLLKQGEKIRQYGISFLPPMILTFELPENYPSSSPPSFTLTCSWLTHQQITSLRDKLSHLYLATGGAVVLFSWIQFLREDVLRHLNIHSLLELPSDLSYQDKEDDHEKHTPESGPPVDQNHAASSDLPSIDAAYGSDYTACKTTDDHQRDFSSAADTFELSDSVTFPDVPPHEDQSYSAISLTPCQMLLSHILIHDAEQKRKAFAATLFDCSICSSGWLGSECVQLHECGHIFCRACLSEFWKAQITEGNILGVTCPQAECNATATPAQVKTLVGGELFLRYDRLLLQSSLDCMPDITYCPRPTCASAVIREKSSPAAMCSVCSFAFCVTCKKTYHGTSKCNNESKIHEERSNTLIHPPKTEEGMKALLQDYSTGSKQRRHLLERRYGRTMLQCTIENYVSSLWKMANTKPCPHCFTPIEKDGGCNHMFCTRCNQYFDWN